MSHVFCISDSSPVGRRRDVIVNLDSESEDEIINCDNSEEVGLVLKNVIFVSDLSLIRRFYFQDCVIVNNGAEQMKSSPETSPKSITPPKLPRNSNIIFIDSDSECEEEKKPPASANSPSSEAAVTVPDIKTSVPAQNSDDEALRPIKRKRKSTPNKSSKIYETILVFGQRALAKSYI